MPFRKSTIAKNPFRIAPFCVDITPPIGAPLAYCMNEKIDAPVYIRGLIVDDQSTRIVLASADVIQIIGAAYHHLKRVMAKAAGTTPENVFLHVVHQHDSVRIAPDWNDIFERYRGSICTPAPYYQDMIRKLDAALAQALKTFQPVFNLATAERRMAGLASNRRLLDASGKVYAMRWSMCTDPLLQREPTGTIDPLLRSVGFMGKGDELLAVMHFYASHPMTAYMRSMVGADVPGVALDYVRQHLGAAPLNIYFAGCGGNVTFGKYSMNPPERSLRVLGERLGRGLLANCRALEECTVGSLAVVHRQFEVPLSSKVSDAAMRKAIRDGHDKSLAMSYALFLETKKNWRKWRKAVVSRISLGPNVHVLSMPGEVMVEYQLYAQSLLPEKFLACAAYGQGIYQYIPTKAMFAEGGYEPECGAITTPDAEASMKQAIAGVLEDLM